MLVDGDLVAVDTPDALVGAHGGPSRLVVETGATDLDLPYPAESTDRGLVIEGIEPRDIGDVVDALEAAGATYDALSWRDPDLETVYLALTGEAPGPAGRDADGVVA